MVDSHNNPAVGIDLGTTNTVVAFQTDPIGPQVLDTLQPVEERGHLEKLPRIRSAVSFEPGDKAVVGPFATIPPDSFLSIKSYMGTRWRAKHPYSEKLIPPAYVSAHILKVAFEALDAKFFEWDRTAVITVPASFNTDQRSDTILAAKMAGFQKVQLLDEPTAAFYFYFDLNRKSGDFSDINNILIFDFGGGTLDVSIIHIEERGDSMYIDAIGRSRYNNLGGDDIDIDLATFFLACWELENDNTYVTKLKSWIKKGLYRLFIEKCRLYKEEVEDYIKNDLPMPEFRISDETIYGENDHLQINFSRKLTRAQYDDITGRYLQSKSDLNIYRPIEEALSVANNINHGFSRDDLDLILYTGGASNMISVQAALEAYFSPKPCMSISPDYACDTVALGAACCRYDNRRNQRLEMPSRLLECLFTRKPGEGTYTTLVPLTCTASSKFRKVKTQFILKRPTIKLKFPLFRGVSPHDHQLSPLRNIEFSPPERIIPEGTSYDVFYRMNEDKTIELQVEFKLDDGPLSISAEVDLSVHGEDLTTDLQLSQVNTIEG